VRRSGITETISQRTPSEFPGPEKRDGEVPAVGKEIPIVCELQRARMRKTLMEDGHPFPPKKARN